MTLASAYGDEWAAIYDSYPAHPTAADAEPAAELLSSLAPRGRALEFGIGTGRIAIPLTDRGIEVTGIEASRAMLERMWSKPGGAGIPAIVGDISRDRAGGAFDLVYAAFNTVLMVTEQDGQVQCFENAASHLSPHGKFVVETFVPDFQKLTSLKSVNVRDVSDDGIWLLVMRHEPLRQTIMNETVLIGHDQIKRYPVSLRYVWPSELDLMARMAGFRLCARYQDWQRNRFTEASRNQVSVYQLAPSNAGYE